MESSVVDREVSNEVDRWCGARCPRLVSGHTPSPTATPKQRGADHCGEQNPGRRICQTIWAAMVLLSARLAGNQ